MGGEYSFGWLTTRFAPAGNGSDQSRDREGCEPVRALVGSNVLHLACFRLDFGGSAFPKRYPKVLALYSKMTDYGLPSIGLDLAVRKHIHTPHHVARIVKTNEPSPITLHIEEHSGGWIL